MKYLSLLACSLFALTCVGCGSSPTTVAPGSKDQLQEFGDLLKNLPPDIKRLPTNLSEFDAIEPLIPNTSSAIRAGTVIYVWGTGYQAGSSAIIAYDKIAPDSGGYVLLQDGTVKSMTADEFKAAPKAVKK